MYVEYLLSYHQPLYLIPHKSFSKTARCTISTLSFGKAATQIGRSLPLLSSFMIARVFKHVDKLSFDFWA